MASLCIFLHHKSAIRFHIKTSPAAHFKAIHVPKFFIGETLTSGLIQTYD